MMTAATSSGLESIGTWLVFNSVVVAFMRFAKRPPLIGRDRAGYT
jgi:hypothetical protein